MARDGGQLYADYESRGLTALIDAKLSPIDLASITNYQHFDYTTNSDYDFTAVPQIWSDQHNSYRAISQELRARTNTESPLGFLGGLYYQDTALSFAQSAVFYGSEDTLASPSNRYVSALKDSATDGQTFSGYGQLTWRFVPAWELTAGARLTRETKSSYFVQPYVNPFFAALYAANDRLSADQHFHNASPEVTLSWKPVATAMLYAAYRTGYKSGGFSNSADDVVNSAGVRDLTFKPETARGAEVGLKMTLLRALRLNVDVYDYRFSDLQVDFFNAQNFALITTNAGAARSEGVEVQGQYAVTAIQGMGLHGAVNYNVATYQHYIGPCYGGQTQSQGCNIVGPAPDHATLQDLGGRATADSPKWTSTIGVDYERPVGTGWAVAAMADMRLSGRYSVSPFAQPLDIQPSYVTLDATIRLSTANGRWQVALIGKNLTNRFVVTFAGDEPSTGTAAGGVTGRLADQYAIFAPARTVQLQLTYKR
jgi:iron complex outermembrane receptor protein